MKRKRVNVRGLIGATRKRFARSRVELEKYERELILRDARALAQVERSVSRDNLTEHFVGRYDARYLDKALKRLYDGGYLTNRTRFRSWGRGQRVSYQLPEEPQAQAA